MRNPGPKFFQTRIAVINSISKVRESLFIFVKPETSKNPLLIPDRFLLVQGADCRSSEARSPLRSSSLLSKEGHICEKQPPSYTHLTANRQQRCQTETWSVKVSVLHEQGRRPALIVQPFQCTTKN